MTKPKIPEGYRQDAQGRLVPEATIKQIDLDRHALVTAILAQAQERSGELAAFRAAVLDQVDQFVAASAARYKVKMGGKKGNLTLVSFDGRYKVVVAQAETLSFDERLQVAKELIDACIRGWPLGMSRDRRHGRPPLRSRRRSCHRPPAKAAHALALLHSHQAGVARGMQARSPGPGPRGPPMRQSPRRNHRRGSHGPQGGGLHRDQSPGHPDPGGPPWLTPTPVPPAKAMAGPFVASASSAWNAPCARALGKSNPLPSAFPGPPASPWPSLRPSSFSFPSSPSRCPHDPRHATPLPSRPRLRCPRWLRPGLPLSPRPDLVPLKAPMHLLVFALIAWIVDRRKGVPHEPDPDHYPVSGFCDL